MSDNKRCYTADGTRMQSRAHNKSSQAGLCLYMVANPERSQRAFDRREEGDEIESHGNLDGCELCHYEVF
jgi:hypothetical protein